MLKRVITVATTGSDSTCGQLQNTARLRSNSSQFLRTAGSAHRPFSQRSLQIKCRHSFVSVQLLFAVAVWLGVFSLPAAADVKPSSLDVAVRSGVVEVSLRGRGSCSGDSVSVTVQRKSKNDLQLVIESGTVLESTSGDVQSMVCYGVKYEKVGDKYRRVDVMVLDDDKEHTFLLEAYCRDRSKPTPQRHSLFSIGVVDKSNSRLIEKGKKAGATTRAIQVAIWNRTDASDFEESSRSISASPAETEVAQGILAAARAAEQGNSEEETRSDEMVRVLVQNFLGELVERRKQLPYLRGDNVEVTAGEAPIQVLTRTIATAKQGDRFNVQAVTRYGVRVSIDIDGKKNPQQGWISFDDIKLVEGATRGKGRPVLRKIGEIVSEAELDVVTVAERGF